MTVGKIFTKIGNFVENRQIFMLLNCNCTKLANFWRFLNMLGAVFSWTQCSSRSSISSSSSSSSSKVMVYQKKLEFSILSTGVVSMLVTLSAVQSWSALWYSASVLDRLNALLEPNGSLSLSERGVIDGAIPTVRPHSDFRYDDPAANLLHLLWYWSDFYGCPA